ncbi:hypothetical protein BFS86_09090 [Shewanella algae]|nr:hypothetical protein BFS86_09090 [Shewanella algae]
MTFPTSQTLTRPGQNQGAGDSRALFLKLYAGEVLKQFKPACIALSLTKVRTITSGKSFQFPMIGRTSAKYHKPGELIQAGTVKHAEVTVTIDDIVIAPVFVAEIDEALSHYESRAEYSADCSRQLAELIDRNIFRMLAKAALITNKTEAQAAGLNLLEEEVYTDVVELRTTNDNGDTLNPAQSLVDAIYRARTAFHKANITDAKYAVVKPETFELLVNASGQVGNMAWLNSDVGGQGGVAVGGTGPNGQAALRIAGIPVYESNHLPTTNESAGINDPEPLDAALGSGNTEKYRGDYSRIVGLVFTKDAVATLKLKDISVQHVPEPLRLGHNIIAKMAVGHNILRPACAIAIVKPAEVAAAARTAKAK